MTVSSFFHYTHQTRLQNILHTSLRQSTNDDFDISTVCLHVPNVIAITDLGPNPAIFLSIYSGLNTLLLV